MRPMRLTDGIYEVDGMRVANVYLVVIEDGLMLVDSGMPGNAKRILAFTKNLGHQPRDLRFIVLRLWAWPARVRSATHHCPQQAIGQAFGPGVRTDDPLAAHITGLAGDDHGQDVAEVILRHDAGTCPSPPEVRPAASHRRRRGRLTGHTQRGQERAAHPILSR